MSSSWWWICPDPPSPRRPRLGGLSAGAAGRAGAQLQRPTQPPRAWPPRLLPPSPLHLLHNVLTRYTSPILTFDPHPYPSRPLLPHLSRAHPTHMCTHMRHRAHAHAHVRTHIAGPHPTGVEAPGLPPARPPPLHRRPSIHRSQGATETEDPCCSQSSVHVTLLCYSRSVLATWYAMWYAVWYAVFCAVWYAAC